MNQTEKHLMAGELSAALADMGVSPCSYRAALAIIEQSPDSVGRSIRLSDAVSFLRVRKRGFRPYARIHDAASRTDKVRQTAAIIGLG